MFIKGKVNQIDCNFSIKKNKWQDQQEMVSITRINFFLQNKFFESSQGDPDNFLTHNNHKQ